jgi:hypothetical protein
LKPGGAWSGSVAIRYPEEEVAFCHAVFAG